MPDCATLRPLLRLLGLAGLLTLAHPVLAAMPFLSDGMHEAPVEMIQFRGSRGGNFPSPGRDGGVRPPRFPDGPRFPGGGFRPPGIFLPPFVQDDPPPRRRPPRVVIEDEDDEPVVRRPRRPRREVRPPPRPVAVRPAPTRRAAPPPPRPPAAPPRAAQPRLPPISIPRLAEVRLVRDEVLLELRAGTNVAQVLARHRLTEISTQRFELANATILRARVDGNRTARTALQQMAGDARVASAQPNYIYALQQNPTPQQEAAPAPAGVTSPPAEPAPASVAPVAPLPARKPQYVLEKLGLSDAHHATRGAAVKVALIDTGIDDRHPELEGVIAGRFDALAAESENIPAHGTAMAGAIVAKASLRGVSPAAHLLVARSFTGSAKAGSGAAGTSFHILASLDWSHAQGARVLNLSFAGPQDRLLSRALDGAKSRKIIPIAAAGNAGPKSAPLYPAADPSVLSVTATDADDKVFSRANAGAHIAIAAPGVDVIAAAPEAGYAFTSGTSIAAAHISGLVALMLERNPDLDLAQIRTILRETALDLGAKGQDPIYGAGRANAAAALSRVSEKAPKAP